MKRTNVAIFASGEGTNAQNIIRYFKNVNSINIRLVISNNFFAKVLVHAEKAGIERVSSNEKYFFESDILVEELKGAKIDWIILAGFLWKISDKVIKAFPDKIINIHPALLPKFGGKGMYGMNVHRAVIDAKETESGITIHYVNEKYDEGKIIAQYKCDIEENETPETLANKVRQLEHEYYPKIIEREIYDCRLEQHIE